uniref:Candidate secreted effector Minc03750 n=1 Tax=Meloidogyne incognita TaxID=6306 RepID=A0A343JGX4_MELIC|nr:candidate secreted effector Minc03750 [Meloidogyne incognita]
MLVQSLNYLLFILIFETCSTINVEIIQKRFQRTLGCSEQDHRSCDDVCKGDSYWYGFCSAWDGRDLKCSCSGYRYPLDGNVCGPSRQQKCVEECRGKGQESGGYCVVLPSSENRRGVPKCSCFGKPR